MNIQIGDIVHTSLDTSCIVESVGGDILDVWVWRLNPYFSESEGDNPEDEFYKELITISIDDVVRVGN